MLPKKALSANRVFGSSNFDTTFLPNYTITMFFRLCDRKFNEDFKNVHENAIIPL